LVAGFFPIPSLVSLAVVIGILAVAIGVSLVLTKPGGEETG
jgi:hypothetical protein